MVFQIKMCENENIENVRAEYQKEKVIKIMNS